MLLARYCFIFVNSLYVISNTIFAIYTKQNEKQDFFVFDLMVLVDLEQNMLMLTFCLSLHYDNMTLIF